MQRRRILWGIAIVAVGLFGLWLSTARAGSAGSTLSAESSGWLVAQHLIESRVETRITDRPIEPQDGVLALVFPWQRRLGEREIDGLVEHLRKGGVVLLAHSEDVLQPQEIEILDTLNLHGELHGEDAPLVPWQWWDAQKARWTLQPTDEWSGDAPSVEIPALRNLVAAPQDAVVLYHAPDEEPTAERPAAESPAAERPVIFIYSTQGGRVVVLPAALDANAEILTARNADLLVTLAEWLDRPWIFDEYHHGLTAPDLIVEGKAGFAWDLFILHLFVIYGLAVWALARRFGPPWSKQPVHAGSAATFLRNLGGFHRRLGHHGEVAPHLVERAIRLYPRLAPEREDLLRQAEAVDDDATLLQLAAAVSRGSVSRGSVSHRSASHRSVSSSLKSPPPAS